MSNEAKRDELNSIVRTKYQELIEALENLVDGTGLDYKIDYQVQDDGESNYFADGNEDSSNWNASWC